MAKIAPVAGNFFAALGIPRFIIEHDPSIQELKNILLVTQEVAYIKLPIEINQIITFNHQVTNSSLPLRINQAITFNQHASKGEHTIAFDFLTLTHEAKIVKHEKVENIITFTHNIKEGRGTTNTFQISQSMVMYFIKEFAPIHNLNMKSNVSIYKYNDPDFVLGEV